MARASSWLQRLCSRLKARPRYATLVMVCSLGMSGCEIRRNRRTSGLTALCAARPKGFDVTSSGTRCILYLRAALQRSERYQNTVLERVLDVEGRRLTLKEKGLLKGWRFGLARGWG